MGEGVKGMEGRSVLVTGSTRGIGRAVAARLTADGARVAVHGRNAEVAAEVAAELGAGAIGVSADLSDAAAADRLVRATVEALGALDGLVSNAGVGFVGPSSEVDTATWDRVIQLNLSAAFHCARAAAPFLRRRRGAIVNVASVAAMTGIAERAAYSASKAGLLGLTRVLAAEWGPEIRVNALAPGYVRTDLVAGLIRDGRISEDEIRDATPLSRMGEPHDIASAAAFLLGDDARFISGQTLVVDGGWLTSAGAPSDR